MHAEALTQKAAELYRLCPKFKGFYLVGGTALALQIGHRVSVDLDLFSQKALPLNLLSRVKQVFRGCSIALTYRSPEQLDCAVDGVKMTFFYFPYPVIDPCKKIERLSVASICEIAAMKAFAIGKRLSYKDYIDWYFLLKEKHVNVAEIIRHAKKKFGGDFNDRLFLGQLVSLEDVSTQKIEFLRDPVNRETVESFLKNAVRAFGV